MINKYKILATITARKSMLVGMIDIRHRLSDYLIQYGGQLGYCVLKSERQKGYAKLMVKFVIEKSRESGLEKILVSCYRSNVSSAKTIISNGGVLENEVIEDGELVQRDWINC